MILVNSRIFYSVLLFVLIMLLIMINKPLLMFDKNGNIKSFGIEDNQTMYSLGVFTVVMSILSLYIFSLIDLLKN